MIEWNVGDKKYFRFLPPFDINNSNGGKIKLASEELIKEAAYSRDVKLEIYKKFNILDKYEKHVSENKKILGFRGPQGGYFYVPEDYIVIKKDNSIPYSDAVIMVNIGLMPVHHPFEPINNEIKRIVTKHLGIKTDDVKIARISAEIPVTLKESEQIMLTRMSVSRSGLGPDAEREILSTSLCKALDRISALENYIISCQTPCCCPEDPNLNVGDSTDTSPSVVNVSTSSNGDINATNLFSIQNGFDDGNGFHLHKHDDKNHD